MTPPQVVPEWFPKWFLSSPVTAVVPGPLPYGDRNHCDRFLGRFGTRGTAHHDDSSTSTTPPMKSTDQEEPMSSTQQTGAERIATERQRQINEEGYTSDHDAEHDPNDLTNAATAYLIVVADDTASALGELYWPWDLSSFKPSTDRRNLIKAGALIAAAIDRFDAAATERS